MGKKHDDELNPTSNVTPKQKAVRTTIVGGQPPGNERPLQPIPVGIEELLAMAAVDSEFADALFANRDRAIDASGVSLTATERAIIGATDTSMLSQMIKNVQGAIPDADRRTFMQRSAAALLAFLGGAAVVGAAACDQKVTGSRPIVPNAGVRPEGNPAKAAESTKDTPPDAETDKPDAPPPKPDAGPPPSKVRPRPSRGIRPDRPQPTRGIRPDKPKQPKAIGGLQSSDKKKNR